MSMSLLGEVTACFVSGEDLGWWLMHSACRFAEAEQLRKLYAISSTRHQPEA